MLRGQKLGPFFIYTIRRNVKYFICLLFLSIYAYGSVTPEEHFAKIISEEERNDVNIIEEVLWKSAYRDHDIVSAQTYDFLTALRSFEHPQVRTAQDLADSIKEKLKEINFMDEAGHIDMGKVLYWPRMRRLHR